MHLMHNGHSKISDERIAPTCYPCTKLDKCEVLSLDGYGCRVLYNHFGIRENVMLRKIYRAIVVGNAAVVTYKASNILSDRRLNKMGVSRSEFIQERMNKIISELSAQEAIALETRQLNRNLVGSN